MRRMMRGKKLSQDRHGTATYAIAASSAKSRRRRGGTRRKGGRGTEADRPCSSSFRRKKAPPATHIIYTYTSKSVVSSPPLPPSYLYGTCVHVRSRKRGDFSFFRRRGDGNGAAAPFVGPSVASEAQINDHHHHVGRGGDRGLSFLLFTPSLSPLFLQPRPRKARVDGEGGNRVSGGGGSPFRFSAVRTAFSAAVRRSPPPLSSAAVTHPPPFPFGRMCVFVRAYAFALLLPAEEEEKGASCASGGVRSFKSPVAVALALSLSRPWRHFRLPPPFFLPLSEECLLPFSLLYPRLCYSVKVCPAPD